MFTEYFYIRPHLIGPPVTLKAVRRPSSCFSQFFSLWKVFTHSKLFLLRNLLELYLEVLPKYFNAFYFCVLKYVKEIQASTFQRFFLKVISNHCVIFILHLFQQYQNTLELVTSTHSNS